MQTIKSSHLHEGVISRSQFRELTGISRTTEWRLGQLKKLPTLVTVNGHVLGYLSSSYEKWLTSNTVVEG